MDPPTPIRQSQRQKKGDKKDAEAADPPTSLAVSSRRNKTGATDNISDPPTLLAASSRRKKTGATDNTSSNKNDATPDGNNCLESDGLESSDLVSAQSTPSPKLLCRKKYLETLHKEKENVEDDDSTSKAVHSNKSPSKYEEADDDDNEDNFFTSESFLEVVSGIADDLEPQKPPANPPTSTTNEQCSMPPPHKPTIMELAAMSKEAYSCNSWHNCKCSQHKQQSLEGVVASVRQ